MFVSKVVSYIFGICVCEEDCRILQQVLLDQFMSFTANSFENIFFKSIILYFVLREVLGFWFL
jgi:hypothetical protein